ncbi:polysaccharide deacetylase family protein [Pendulispora brunnea]|uniref:Polysaccharide deacetylase family protein n=1 Tax=Pendulispora brunnea TaxID=2905690 RepID=A0ABZ2KLR3_9BACT
MSVHVSIHDVSPAFRSEIEFALEMSHARGIKPALLVVPNFHGEHPLEEDASFCGWLRDLQADGHEIFLHGFFHAAGAPRLRDDGRPGGTFSRFFAQRVVSGGEAEFSDVSADEARARLAEGERILSKAGLHIDGFIPPAWSMPPWMLDILAERRIAYTEDHLYMYAPSARRKKPSLVLNYASRTPSRLFSSVAFCRIAKPAKALLPARIAIHPADMRFRLLRHEVQHLLKWAEGDTVERATALV